MTDHNLGVLINLLASEQNEIVSLDFYELFNLIVKQLTTLRLCLF